ncbi:MAG TPA: hypothetical protein VF770_03545 [Solirubrobacterales bacterium]
MSGPNDWIDDLQAAARLSRLVAAADPDGPPTVDLVYPAAGFEPLPRRLAFLAGSFNPPHAAHLAMARATLDAGLDRVVFALSRRTVDKTTVTGLGLADRLLLLSRIASESTAAPAEREPPLGVALVNRGLYVDEAEIFRRAWPALDELAVVLGFDKIVQVFDPRYYEDRDAALERLFAAATVYVAPRAGADSTDLSALLNRPENRRFADRVRTLPMPPDLAHVSSSEVRDAGGIAEGLPTTVREFLRHTRAFAPPVAQGEGVDAYAVRLALLDALARGALPASDAEPRLLALALADTLPGRALRAWLADPEGDPPDLLRSRPSDQAAISTDQGGAP